MNRVSPVAAFRVLFTLGAALLYLLDGAPVGAHEPAATPVAGVVIDGTDGGPVPGIRVVCPAASKVAWTDEKGAFLLKGVPAGVVVLKVGGAVVPERTVRIESREKVAPDSHQL